ncbi:MAG: DUF3592 domain-containing protein [Burkholderiales bacterium]|nr:DUF3592 domain-containing protein [Burkholderiales bacterium]
MSTGIIFTIVFLLLAVAAMVWSALEFFRARQSVSWPTVQATIRLCKLQRYWRPMTGYKDSIGQEWNFQILYDYSVRGQAYQGYRPFFGSTPNKRVARNIVAKFPEGSLVSVSYHPQKPGLSALIPGVNRFTISGLFAGPFLLVLAYVSWYFF